MLFSADDTDNKDNSLETDPFACWQPGDTCYEWQANGMLAGVRTPDGRTITFGYDALGRRVSKGLATPCTVSDGTATWCCTNGTPTKP